MPQFSDVHLAADQTAQSLVFDKRLASDLIAQWPKDKPFDASVILADHPELRQHKSVVLDLAYEEYCRRTSRGEILSAHEFAARFRDIQRSLLCLIDVHQLLHENPQLMEDSTELVWPKVGEKFQDLELTANLGRGAFARVFLARESGIGGRLVVSKLSKTGGREAEFLGRLEHPHIVPIFSVKHDEQSGLSAICMPYLGRATLLDLIDGIAARNNLPASASQLRLIIQSFDVTPPSASQHRKPIRSAWQRTSLDALIDLGIQLAEGLEFAHEQNVCHGDIKPSNVLITPQGQAMLMDFNLSFQTQGDDKALGGTLPYMAPEQLRRIVDREAGQSPASNERTDIYALGVVMYELLAGRYPFGSIPVDEPKHQAATNLLRRQEHGFRPLREVNPNIDRHLAGCIEKCLTYNAEDRWRTATELRSALEYANSLRQRSRRWVRRHRKTVLAAACAASLAVSASAYSMLTREPLEVRLYRAGTEALSTQNYDVAIGSFTELAALTPESPEVLFSLGRAYQGKRQFKDALEYFSDCWNIDPDHRPSQACIAQCQAELLRDQKKLSQQERTREFLGVIETYKAAFGDPRVSESALNNNIGYCYLTLKDYASAEQYLNAALDDDRHRSVVHHHLALLNRLRANSSPELYDLKILDDALKFADGVPETYFETARGYSSLLRKIKDEDQRNAAFKSCLICCRKAVESGLPPHRLDDVLIDLKLYNESSDTPFDIGEVQKLRNRPIPVQIVESLNPLIDSVLVQSTFSEQSISRLIVEK